MRLSDLHRAFLADLRARGCSSRTHTAYASDLAQLVKFLGRDDLRGFTDVVMVDYPGWLVERGYQTGSIGRKLAAASSFGAFLERRGDVTRNPLHRASRPKKPKRLPRPAPSATVTALLAHAAPRDAALVGLQVYGSLRIGEVVALDREDVGQALLVRNAKGDKDRALPIIPQLRKLLDAWLAERGDAPGPLFPHVATYQNQYPPQARLTTKAVRRVLARLVKAAGVGRVTPHQLRHTFGTEAIRAGVHPRVLSQWMGHQDSRTTDLYTQVVAQDMTAGAEKLGAYWDSATAPVRERLPE